MRLNELMPEQIPVVKKGLVPRFPNSLVLLFLIIVLADAQSWVVPA